MLDLPHWLWRVVVDGLHLKFILTPVQETRPHPFPMKKEEEEVFERELREMCTARYV